VAGGGPKITLRNPSSGLSAQNIKFPKFSADYLLVLDLYSEKRGIDLCHACAGERANVAYVFPVAIRPTNRKTSIANQV
jgi:hypothetical protein